VRRDGQVRQLKSKVGWRLKPCDIDGGQADTSQAVEEIFEGQEMACQVVDDRAEMASERDM